MNNTSLIRVCASAGAGKTYQLALHYIKILKQFKIPSKDVLNQAVAITFTNKAAQEMKDRVIGFLKEIALNSEKGKELSTETGMDSHLASKWLDVIISNYSDFHIRTIDSLLFAILKCLSFETGDKPEAKVVFSIESIANEAFDLILSDSSEETEKLVKETLRTFLEMDERGGFYPEGNLRRRLLGEILPKVKGPLKVKKINTAEYNRVLKEAEEAYRALFELITIFDSQGYINKNKIRGLNKDTPISELCGRAIAQKEACELLKKNAKIKEKDKLELEKLHKNFVSKLNSWNRCDSKAKAYLKVGGYARILIKVKELIEVICKREGIIIGGDYWTGTILDKLRESGVIPLIYAHFSSRFRHFLFDEFQDTSRLQWDALYPLLEDALANGGSLFVVGDVKQAIYRWRGGDWRLFEEIADKNSYFAMVEKPVDRTLSQNYRSHPHLVDFFNKLFRHFADADSVKEYIVPHMFSRNTPDNVKQAFTDSITSAFSNCEQEAASFDTGKVSGKCTINITLLIEAPNRDSAREKIKESFISDIKKEWESRRDNTDRTPIAVLVRTNKDGEEISSWLIHENIPVVTENALKLGTSLVVKGVICFLSYLYEPENPCALYGFLSSGLLPSGPKNEEQVADKWISAQKDEWIRETNRIRDKLAPIMHRRAPYELMWSFMEEVNLFDRLKETGDLHAHEVFVERLLEITHQFQLEEGPNLGKFLSFWKEGGLEERVGLPENIVAVRVITIHKAKGLEFPVVFIPFTDWSPQHDLIEVYEDSLVYIGGNLERLPEELKSLKEKTLLEATQEAINLFYVAVTRAEESLYMYLRPRPPKGGGWSKPLSYCLYDLIKSIVADKIPHLHIKEI